jgi:hypothetical protein
MDYEPVLALCEDPAVGAAISDALKRLFADPTDVRNLANDTHERTIAEMLARYLRPHFDKYDVNVDYNRMGDAPKEVTWRIEAGPGPDRVYPDITVHRRFTHDNLLAIELKKDSNRQAKTEDILKLRAYRKQLGYSHALFIRLGVGRDAGLVSECEWVFP